MKTTGSIITIVIGILTSISVSAHQTHDSILTHGKNTGNKVQLDLDSLKQIEAEEEQPVMDVQFFRNETSPFKARTKLLIFGQNLSEPKEEGYEVL